MRDASRLILLADDDADDRELLTQVLLRLEPSLEILSASSGRQAISLLQTLPGDKLPALIILDFNMPDMTAEKVLQVIGDNEQYSRIPRIVWSTSDASLYEQVCKKNGAAYYFKKPDEIHAIVSLGEKILSLAAS